MQRFALGSENFSAGFAPIGSIEIFPKDSELLVQWEMQKESLLVAFDDEFLSRLAGFDFGKSKFEFYPPRIGFVDAKALEIARNIRNEMETGEIGTSECIEAWLKIFGAHLLREYSSLSEKSISKPKGGLSPWTWRRIEEYIQGNISEKIHVDKLAEIAQISPSHFARSFRETTGQSPHQHIIGIRLDAARKLVADTHSSFEEIAKACGFSSNSHMTSTMKRFWGVNPKEVRRNSR